MRGKVCKGKGKGGGKGKGKFLGGTKSQIAKKGGLLRGSLPGTKGKDQKKKVHETGGGPQGGT